ncbi:MAG: hypothetical protein K2O89_01670 [Clostridia bacterium]|nr:hypothetical protein [Clostridia bacterium]
MSNGKFSQNGKNSLKRLKKWSKWLNFVPKTGKYAEFLTKHTVKEGVSEWLSGGGRIRVNPHICLK